MLGFTYLQARRLGLKTSEYCQFKLLFDRQFYLATQPDVAAANARPDEHYFNSGWREGRNPSEKFNTIWYLQTFEDAALSGLNPLIHYVRFGILDGRATTPGDSADDDWLDKAENNRLLPQPMHDFLRAYNTIRRSGLFRSDYYCNQFPVERGDPIEHYLRYGGHRGYEPNPNFSSAWYLEAYADVAATGANPFVHYLRYGLREGRRIGPSDTNGQRKERSEADAIRDDFSARITALGNEAPLLSVIIPTYNSNLDLLNACVQSVRNGAYTGWEMVIVDDASPNVQVRQFLSSLAEEDPRIRTIFNSRNGNISRTTNTGITNSRGSFLIFLDHDDELPPDALLCVAEAVVGEPQMDVWYSDQFKCDQHGVCYEHFFKPDWSPVYLLGVMYVGHLLAVRSSIARAVGGCDSHFDNVQDYEMMLRVSERTSAIGHIPLPLYKWRAIAGSIAAGVSEKTGIEEKQRKAVECHLRRLGRSWVPRRHPTLPHRLLLEAGPTTPLPKVSIVVPSKDQGRIVERCLSSLFELTDYPDFEVIIVDNGTTDPVAIAAFERHLVKRVNYARKFNFSEACNLGAAIASGSHIVFLNNDTEVIDRSWLRNLMAFFEDPEIGAVGPVLLYPDRRVQHAGVVLGARGTADHVMRFFPENVDGYAGSLACAREVSAVTAACIAMSAALFNDIGQFSLDFNKHYQDVDLCLKVLQQRKRILCVGNVRLIHHESVSRKAEGYDFGDRAILIDRWFEAIRGGERYFNPNLDVQKLDYSPKAGVLNF